MKKYQDFSWNKDKVRSPTSLGKIIPIPADREHPSNNKEELMYDYNKADVVIDEFKERISSVLSKKLKKE